MEKSYNYHGVSQQSVNITGFIHNINKVSLWFLQPFSVDSADFPCGRALPDITVRSGSPANFQSPDSPKTGRSPSRTPDFYHLKKWEKKNPKKKLKFFFSKFFSRFFFVCLFIWPGNFWQQICVQEPYLMRSNNL